MKSPASVDFIRESLITLLSDSLDKIAAFVAFVYFANYFSTEAFGTAYTVIGISMVAGSAPKAIGAAISKRVSEDTRTHDEYFIMGVGSIVASAALFGAAVFAFGRVWNSQFEYLAVAGMAHFAARPFLFHVERVYDGVGMTGAAATLDFIDGVLTSTLRFALILGVGMGEAGLLYSGAISAFVVGVLAYAYQFGLPTSVPGWTEVHDIKGYAGWSLLTRISGEALHNAPVVLAGMFLTPTVASWLKSAQTLVMPATLSVRSVINSIFVQVSGDLERGSINVTPIQNGVDVGAILAIPILAGSVVMGDELMVTVFGEGYGGTGLVLAAVAAMMVLKGQTRIFVSILNGADHPDAVGKINALHAILAAGSFSAAMLLGGLELFLGVLVAVYASWLVVTYRALDHRVIDVDELSWRFVAEQVTAGTVMAVLVAALLDVVQVDSWLTLLLPVVAGAAVYGAVLLGISGRCRSMVRTVTQRIAAE